MRISVLFAVCLIAVGAAAGEAARWSAFPAYPKARRLCAEHVDGDTMHVEWQSYAVKDKIDKVTVFYEKALGVKAAVDKASGERNFSAPGGKSESLEIYPADKNDTFPHCDAKPKKGERTVILVSQSFTN